LQRVAGHAAPAQKAGQLIAQPLDAARLNGDEA
jgi:hypothetical protein